MAMSIKNRIIEYLQKIDPIIQHRPPFAITFDKVTLLKRSMQVTMMIIMIDGQLTPIYLQSPLCKTELSGEELANNCVNVLKSFGLTKAMLQQQLTGCAVDGAYVHMQINKHLCKHIGMDENWLVTSWDIAHLLELAIGDVQNHKKFNWLQTFNKICASLMKKYSYGKQYELLLEASEVIEEEILQPKSFHAIRFVSSQLRVYETMLRDWSTFYYLQEEEDKTMTFNHGDVSARTRQKVSVQQTGDKDMDSIKVNYFINICFEKLSLLLSS
jgi:hypothetical protein